MRSGTHGPSFEYDGEANGESDESFEAADEATDESDEAFEAADEASDESDESFEAADEASDEASDEADESYEAADEASDESDESFEAADEGSDEAVDEASDEAVDEATNATIRTRYALARERARRRALSARLRADQVRQIRRANHVQRVVARRLGKIGRSGSITTYPVSSSRGVTYAKLTLRTGRSTVARISPAYVSAGQFNSKLMRTHINVRRLAAANAAIKRDVRRLAAAQKVFASQETSARLKSDRAVSNRIREIALTWEKRFNKQFGSQTGVVASSSRSVHRKIRDQKRRALAQSFIGLGGAMAGVVYGNSKITSFENLTVAGSTAAYLLAPTLIDQFKGHNSSKSKTVSKIANGAAYAGAILNPLTIGLILRNRQRERFITGVVEASKVDSTAAADTKGFDLGIAASTFDDLELTKVPVVATIVGGDAGRTVKNVSITDKGKLVVEFDPAPTATALPAGTKVAFMVDTQPEATA